MPSALADTEQEAVLRAAAGEQLVAGFAQQVRDIDRGQRVGAFDHELVSRAQTAERLPRLQRGEGAFQPAEVEVRLRHARSIAESDPSGGRTALPEGVRFG